MNRFYEEENYFNVLFSIFCFCIVLIEVSTCFAKHENLMDYIHVQFLQHIMHIWQLFEHDLQENGSAGSDSKATRSGGDRVVKP